MTTTKTEVTSSINLDLVSEEHTVFKIVGAQFFVVEKPAIWIRHS